MAVSSALAQASVERVGRVNAIAGSATYSPKGGAFVPLSVATKLHQGDTIKTGPGSHVDVDLGGNVGVVQVAPRSTFVLDKITTTDAGAETLTQTELRVDSGAVYAKINKLAKGSRYEISTPKGIAGIRGTAAYVSADGRVTVLDGIAAVAYPNAAGGVDTYIVHAGETVAPDDRPPHPASPEQLREAVEALRDAAGHGVGSANPAFAKPLELDQTFISPTLPANNGAPATFPTD
ncbi:MAG TPA: FecR family protein [Candidatus Limnocylindria bacterium]|nr:FecR family protein [Candidatus Limnocylindria bacterium]